MNTRQVPAVVIAHVKGVSVLFADCDFGASGFDEQDRTTHKET
jgi:hypothetical protein